MTLARFAKRRDQSEREIVDALRLVGCLVWQIDRPFDLLVARAGRLYLLECKTTAKHKLTDLQVLEYEACQRYGAPVAIVTTPSEALAAVGAVR